MTDHDARLDQELARLRAGWRAAPEPPLEAMWQAIDAAAFTAHPAAGVHPWRRWLPMAAMLAAGVAIGLLVPRGPAGSAGNPANLVQEAPGAAAVPAAAPGPFVGIASGYLEQVAALMVTLATEMQQERPLDNTRAQARDLLATTRLLLDQPDTFDPATAGLLDDLELVLAQIARLPNRPTDPDVYLIDQALGEREVMPRLRTLLASAHDNRPY